MKKNHIFLSVIAATFLLASCGGGSAPASSSVASGETSSSQEQTSSSQEASSVSSAEESSTATKYMVRIIKTTGITITPDKETAEKGETVTLTIVLDAGYSLTSLTMNNTALEVSGGKASFTMPNRDVTIRSQISVEGDVVINGDISAAFALEDGVYVARNVRVETDSNIDILVGGTKLSSLALDNRKTFADISNFYGDKTFKIAGNSVYDFFYDPSLGSMPLYVKRVEVIEAPSDVDSLHALFENARGIASDPTTYFDDVNEVRYTELRPADALSRTYDWKKYENSSLATITPYGEDNPTNFVYKSIEDDKYIVVDNYLEGAPITEVLPYNGGSTTTIADDSNLLDYGRNQDTVAFSAKYDLVDSFEDGKFNWQYTADSAICDRETYSHDANFDVYAFSHDVQSISREIYRSYYTGFTIEEDLVRANVDISSVTNDDGTFTTTVNSFKEYAPQTGGGSGTYAVMSKDTYIKYSFVMTFTKAGAPLSGVYDEKVYYSADYNFTTHTFINEAAGTRVKKLTWDYTYGEALEGKPTFDTTPYFATKVAGHIKGTKGTNIVGGGERVASNYMDTNTLQLTVTPATALDGWQYGVTASSNESVIGPEYDYGYHWISSTENAGVSTLTVSNHVDNDVTCTIDVEVKLSTIRNFYINNLVNYYGEEFFTSADTFNMYGGTSLTFNLCAVVTDGGTDTGSLEGITFKYLTNGVETDLVSASVDVAKRYITFTSKACTEITTVTIQVYSPHWNSDWSGAAYDTFTATVYPGGNDPFSDEYIVGEWDIDEETGYIDPEGQYTDHSNIVFTETALNNAYYSDYKLATLTIDFMTYDIVIEFGYKYDDATKTIKTVDQKVTAGASYDGVLLSIICETTTGKIGVCAVGQTLGDDWTVTEEILMGSGYIYEEEDYGSTFVVEAYCFFDKVEA
ncbi:MAG: hypothetical protein K5694_00235 [Bacilli bacterium]|nr:hypothetical protein [Bacilli bacterium]